MNQEDFYISTDPSGLDINFIHHYLSQESYWAKGRSRETVEKSIRNSLCFGVYTPNKQVGFARVVTDFAIFAWVMDVFIADAYRGKGLGKQLVAYIMDYPELQHLQRWGLNTADAHELYRKFGFHASQKPEWYMEKYPNPVSFPVTHSKIYSYRTYEIIPFV